MSLKPVYRFSCKKKKILLESKAYALLFVRMYQLGFLGNNNFVSTGSLIVHDQTTMWCDLPFSYADKNLCFRL